MISGLIRIAYLSAFGALLAVTQMVCACTSVSTLAGASSVKMATSQVHAMPGSTAGLMAVMPADHEGHSGHGNQSGHDDDCPHCDGSSVLAALITLSAYANLPSSPQVKVIVPPGVLKPVARPDLASRVLAGLRWLPPPRDSLVSLKVQLRN